MEENEKMFMEERRERILELIAKEKRTTISELSLIFKTGEATIRRDLAELENRGLIRRTHGGAIPAENTSEEVSIKVRESKQNAEKDRIAAFISRLVRNGESLMMDGGSTTQTIARQLRNKNGLMVVTNSPNLASELVGSNGNQAILAGGFMQDKTYVTVGPITEQNLRQFRVDRVIVGMSSMVTDEGFFTINHYEAEVKRTMMKLGKEVIVAMDSSKIGKVGFSFVSGFDQIDKLIIDNGISKEDLEKLDRHSIEVIIV